MVPSHSGSCFHWLLHRRLSFYSFPASSCSAPRASRALRQLSCKIVAMAPLEQAWEQCLEQYAINQDMIRLSVLRLLGTVHRMQIFSGSELFRSRPSYKVR